MCRNIKTLYNLDPIAKKDEIRSAALQFVRKISGFTKPSAANEEAFNRAVDEIAMASSALLVFAALPALLPGTVRSNLPSPTLVLFADSARDGAKKCVLQIETSQMIANIIKPASKHCNDAIRERCEESCLFMLLRDPLHLGRILLGRTRSLS